jgi:hypothetical protein
MDFGRNYLKLDLIYFMALYGPSDGTIPRYYALHETKSLKSSGRTIAAS